MSQPLSFPTNCSFEETIAWLKASAHSSGVLSEYSYLNLDSSQYTHIYLAFKFNYQVPSLRDTQSYFQF